MVEGEADAIVTAAGASTRLAEIARLTTLTAKPASPLTLELHRVVRTIAVIAVAVGGTFFGLMLLLGNDVTDGFVFAIGVTVALVPEALLPTVTLSLAWGAEQMAKRNVLVRNLEAVETLGSTTFICTDKTGHPDPQPDDGRRGVDARRGGADRRRGLRPDRLVVAVDAGADARRSSAWRSRACAARPDTRLRADGEWRAHGDPMEAALDVFARRIGVDAERDRSERPDRVALPVRPARRRMSVVVDGEVLVKGAPDAVLPLCDDGEAAADVLDALTDQGPAGARRRRPPVG